MNDINEQEMEQKDLISIIVPVYNTADYLPYCLETVAAQTYRNLEIIVVDDGSTDDTPHICDNFAACESRAVVIHQKNQGVAEARNTGKRAAHGQYVSFVDSDDYLHCEAISTLYKAIKSGDGHDLAMIDYIETYSHDENTTDKGDVLNLSKDELIKRCFLNNNDTQFSFIVLWNKLYSKDLIKDVWFTDYAGCDDFDFNIQAYLHSQDAIWMRQSLYFYFQRDGSIMHHEKTWERHYYYVSKLLYTNVLKLPDNSYTHYFIKDLYGKIACLMYWHKHTSKREEVNILCRKYVSDTRRIFWNEKRINPIRKVVLWLQVHSTSFTGLYLKLRKSVLVLYRNK